MEIKQEDLNAKFGSEAKVEEKVAEEPNKPAEPSVEQPAEEIKKEEEEVVVPVEENKVPYSRFKNIHSRAIEAERERNQLAAELEAIKSRPEIKEELSNGWTKDDWITTYGDSELSMKAFERQNLSVEALKQAIREDALKAVREEREQEEERLNENVSQIDNNFEELSALVGRDLTEKEQSDVLDIVDDYTPKDEDGNYLGVILPFDKAWEIYELKQEKANLSKQKSRDNVASLTGSKTQGEPNSVDKEKNFNPLDWNAYQKRI